MALLREVGGGGFAGLPASAPKWGIAGLLLGGGYAAMSAGGDDATPDVSEGSVPPPEHPSTSIPQSQSSFAARLDAAARAEMAQAGEEDTEDLPPTLFGGLQPFGGARDPNVPVRVSHPGDSERMPGRHFTPMSLLQAIYSDEMTDGEFKALQEDLYLSGYFGQAEPDQIAWGNRNDMTTFSAWKSFVTDVTEYTESTGTETTWQELLDAGVQGGLLAGMTLDAEDDAEPGRVFQYQDPKALGQLLDTTAERLIGRRLNADDKRVFVAAMHEAQRANQEAMYTASEPGAGDVDVYGVQPSAHAEEFIQDEYADEAGAHELNNQIGVLMQMIGG